MGSRISITARHNTARHTTPHHATTRHNTTRHATAPHNTTQHPIKPNQPMTTAKTEITAAPQRLSALNTMASKFSVEPEKLLATLKGTVFKGATNEELLALVVVSNNYGLNPLTKEIYAFPAKGGGIVPVVSVDGWIRMANDHPQCDGIEFEDLHDDGGNLIATTCKIHRKDRKHPTVVTEYLNECRRNTDPWKMAHRMLRHKALIQCCRVAFGFSGIHDEDEAKDIAGMRDATPKKAAPSFVIPEAVEATVEAEPEQEEAAQ